MNRRAWLLATFFIILVLPLPARGERVWDADLKRYLTDQEMAHAEVFLTEDEALKLMFPKSERQRRRLSSKNGSAGNFLRNFLKSTSARPARRLTDMP